MWLGRRNRRAAASLRKTETRTVVCAKTGAFSSLGENDSNFIIDEMLAIDAHVAHAVKMEGGDLLNAFNANFCAVFQSAPAAYRAARNIVDRRGIVPLICGIHAGQLYFSGDRVVSSAIGTAASICAFGRGRQIVMSEAVAGLIRPHLGNSHLLRKFDLQPVRFQHELFIVVDAETAAREHRRAFISYRRENGAETARLISSELRKLGVETFIDVDDLKLGRFDDQLLDRIAEMPNFIVVLSRGSLDRCHDAEDWLRREVGHAIATEREIVPLLMPNFSMPREQDVPADIAKLVRSHGITYSHEHAKEVLAKVASGLKTDGDLA
jgi:class 3 adenylate cyclase